MNRYFSRKKLRDNFLHQETDGDGYKQKIKNDQRQKYLSDDTAAFIAPAPERCPLLGEELCKHQQLF